MVSILEASKELARRAFPQRFVIDVDDKLMSTNIALSGAEFCGISLLIGIGVGIGIFVLSLFVAFPYLPGLIYVLVGFYVTFAALTMLLPLYLVQRRVAELEDELPDGLRQVSASLRAGVSMEASLEDVAESKSGAISEEFERTLAQIRRGRSMQKALKAMAVRTQSELYQRAFFMIVEGMERGAEIASVLEAVSNDIRDTQTIQQERRSETMQQVLFLLAAALFAAPLIAGLVMSISGTFSSVSAKGTSAMGGLGSTKGNVLPESMSLVIPLYILIQAAITGLAVGVIRYGEYSKGLMFAGPFMGAAILVFYAAKIFAGFMLPM